MFIDLQSMVIHYSQQADASDDPTWRPSPSSRPSTSSAQPTPSTSAQPSHEPTPSTSAGLSTSAGHSSAPPQQAPEHIREVVVELVVVDEPEPSADDPDDPAPIAESQDQPQPSEDAGNNPSEQENRQPENREGQQDHPYAQAAQPRPQSPSDSDEEEDEEEQDCLNNFNCDTNVIEQTVPLLLSNFLCHALFLRTIFCCASPGYITIGPMKICDDKRKIKKMLCFSVPMMLQLVDAFEVILQHLNKRNTPKLFMKLDDHLISNISITVSRRGTIKITQASHPQRFLSFSQKFLPDFMVCINSIFVYTLAPSQVEVSVLAQVMQQCVRAEKDNLPPRKTLNIKYQGHQKISEQHWWDHFLRIHFNSMRYNPEKEKMIELRTKAFCSQNSAMIEKNYKLYRLCAILNHLVNRA